MPQLRVHTLQLRPSTAKYIRNMLKVIHNIQKNRTMYSFPCRDYVSGNYHHRLVQNPEHGGNYGSSMMTVGGLATYLYHMIGKF